MVCGTKSAEDRMRDMKPLRVHTGRLGDLRVTGDD
jgi:hypothetical protein